MAPVPEDNHNNNHPPSSEEISDFSNPNQLTPIDIVGSSDDSDSDGDSTPGGYTLLPQDPGDTVDSDFYNDDEFVEHLNTDLQEPSIPAVAAIVTSSVEDTVLASEAGAAAPYMAVSQNDLDPELVAKNPNGKIPAYSQVPPMPKDSEPQLWNQERQNSTPNLDTDQENQILKAMSSFSLPDENIPPWARAISEEQWKKNVLPRIKNDSKTIEDNPWTDSSDCDHHTKSWTANFEENNL